MRNETHCNWKQNNITFLVLIYLNQTYNHYYNTASFTTIVTIRRRPNIMKAKQQRNCFYNGYRRQQKCISFITTLHYRHWNVCTSPPALIIDQWNAEGSTYDIKLQTEFPNQQLRSKHDSLFMAQRSAVQITPITVFNSIITCIYTPIHNWPPCYTNNCLQLHHYMYIYTNTQLAFTLHQ